MFESEEILRMMAKMHEDSVAIILEDIYGSKNDIARILLADTYEGFRNVHSGMQKVSEVPSDTPCPIQRTYKSVTNHWHFIQWGLK